MHIIKLNKKKLFDLGSILFGTDLTCYRPDMPILKHLTFIVDKTHLFFQML